MAGLYLRIGCYQGSHTTWSRHVCLCWEMPLCLSRPTWLAASCRFRCAGGGPCRVITFQLHANGESKNNCQHVWLARCMHHFLVHQSPRSCMLRLESHRWCQCAPSLTSVAVVAQLFAREPRRIRYRIYEGIRPSAFAFQIFLHWLRRY